MRRIVEMSSPRVVRWSYDLRAFLNFLGRDEKGWLFRPVPAFQLARVIEIRGVAVRVETDTVEAVQLAADDHRGSTRRVRDRPAILSITCPREKVRAAKTPIPFRVAATSTLTRALMTSTYGLQVRVLIATLGTLNPWKRDQRTTRWSSILVVPYVEEIMSMRFLRGSSLALVVVAVNASLQQPSGRRRASARWPPFLSKRTPPCRSPCCARIRSS